MKKIVVLALAIFMLGLAPKQAHAWGFNPCDDCTFFLKYCCKLPKCPVIDVKYSVWEAVRGKQHRNRLNILGGWRETRLAQLKAIGHDGPRISSGKACEKARSVISYPTHGDEYGEPKPDRWMIVIPDGDAARKVACSEKDKVRKFRQLRAASISDAANAMPQLAIAMEHAAQRAGSAIRATETAIDLRDLSLRLADLMAARNLTNSITNSALGVRMQLQNSLAASRPVLAGLEENCE